MSHLGQGEKEHSEPPPEHHLQSTGGVGSGRGGHLELAGSRTVRLLMCSRHCRGCCGACEAAAAAALRDPGVPAFGGLSSSASVLPRRPLTMTSTPYRMSCMNLHDRW